MGGLKGITSPTSEKTRAAYWRGIDLVADTWSWYVLGAFGVLVVGVAVFVATGDRFRLGRLLLSAAGLLLGLVAHAYAADKRLWVLATLAPVLCMVAAFLLFKNPFGEPFRIGLGVLAVALALTAIGWRRKTWSSG